MADGVNDDFSFRRFVENYVRVGRYGQAADGGTIGACADVRMKQKKVDDGLYSGLNALGSLRRMGGDAVENGVEIGKGRKGMSLTSRVWSTRRVPVRRSQIRDARRRLAR